jgi:hypothetical protein
LCESETDKQLLTEPLLARVFESRPEQRRAFLQRVIEFAVQGPIGPTFIHSLIHSVILSHIDLDSVVLETNSIVAWYTIVGR